ncbi:MAG: class A beta-lactamase-related serine hydrolase [Flavobacteriales bacterium]|nr:class A beta-lactamase-related serine hydrolase [Flavobacteriales bacterium]
MRFEGSKCIIFLGVCLAILAQAKASSNHLAWPQKAELSRKKVLVKKRKDTHLNKTLNKRISRVISEHLEDTNLTHISLYVENLTTGEYLGYEETERYIPASLMKVITMMNVLKNAETNPKSLQTKLIIPELNYTDADSIRMKNNLIAGRMYPVNEIMEEMIVHSDNIASTTLFTYADQMREWHYLFRDLNISMSRDTIRKQSSISPIEYVKVFKSLYEASYLSKEMSDYALELLSGTSYQNGLRAGISSNVRIANKYGQRQYSFNDEKELHDCGIVYYPNAHYLICVMTRGNDFEKQEAAVAQLSELVFKEFDRFYRSIN